MIKSVKVFVPRFDVHELMIRLKEARFECKRERRHLKRSDTAHKKAYWNGKIEETERALKLVTQYLVVPYMKHDKKAAPKRGRRK